MKGKVREGGGSPVWSGISAAEADTRSTSYPSHHSAGKDLSSLRYKVDRPGFKFRTLRYISEMLKLFGLQFPYL